jgi:hypothetical protein
MSFALAIARPLNRERYTRACSCLRLTANLKHIHKHKKKNYFVRERTDEKAKVVSKKQHFYHVKEEVWL